MQQTFDHDEVRLVIAAPPEAIYEVIADITRMPDLSPEVVECRWLDGATEPVVGARFKARNKFSRGRRGNKPVITAVERRRRISWSRTEPFGGAVEWTYEFLPHDDGTDASPGRADRRQTRPIDGSGLDINRTVSHRTVAHAGAPSRADLARGQ